MHSRTTGQAPFGLRWNNHRLVSNGEEAVIRKSIFELFAEHNSKGAVARILNEQGSRTRRGGKWSDMTVSRQLSCSSAKGIYAINKTTTDESGRRIDQPEENWEYIQCDRIVSDELWDQVQTILQDQKENRPTSGKKPVHTFSGILLCSCGGKMNVPSGSAKYVCATCQNKIPCEDIEEIFRDQLSRLILSRPELFGDPPSIDTNIAEAESKLEESLDDLHRTKDKMTHFENLFASNELSLKRFGEVHSPLELKRESLTKEIRRLELLIQRRKNTSLSKKESDTDESSDFSSLVNQWNTVPLDDRRAIVQSLVSHIVIGDGQVEFAYLFPNKSEGFLKDATVSQQMEPPTNDHLETPSDPSEPIYIRLPKQGELCPRTGLSRAKLNDLILESPRNNNHPPVKSFSLGEDKKNRGTRLIIWASLKKYLREMED